MKKSRTLEELHKIREEMHKMTDDERLELLRTIREKYKDLIYPTEEKSKKLEIEI